MDKKCVFCGNSPQQKNKEHIIPKWLISMTGDPKRRAAFGIKYASQTFEHRWFGFDSFQFPACSACNTSYSILEAQVKPIILSILSNRVVDEPQIDTLLDWFDKVRVGLWLGFRYLDNDFFDVKPKFHINQRLGLFDRMLRVYRIGPISDGINFLGTEGPGFQYNPSLFGLRINNYLFISYSRVSLTAECLGFPFPKTMVVDKHGNPEIDFQSGTGFARPSGLLSSFPVGGVTFLQPIFRAMLDDEFDVTFGTEYLRNNTLSYEAGRGCVFLERRGNINRMTSGPLDIFREFDAEVYMNEFAALVVDQQRKDFLDLQSMMDDETKGHSSFTQDAEIIELMTDFLVGRYRKANLPKVGRS